MNRKGISAIAAIFAVILLSVIVLKYNSGRLPLIGDSSPADFQNADNEKPMVVMFIDYVYVSEDQMIDTAELIALGEVITVSKTLQVGSMQQTSYKIQILETYASSVPQFENITLAVTGSSPLDYDQLSIRIEESLHTLLPGDQALFFLGSNQIFNRQAGARMVMRPMGVPQDSFYELRDGNLYHTETGAFISTLTEKVNYIAQRRPQVDR